MTVQHPDVVVSYIKTKNKIRKIVSYRSMDCELRQAHERINDFLSSRFVPSKFAKAYVRGRSIYYNALAHIYNDYFVMLDIKDFFPSICHQQLIKKLYHEINLRKRNQININECRNLVDVCSVSTRGLPLGFINSPILANIYMKEFDNIFYGKIKNLGLHNPIYTRYADDIVVSFKGESDLDFNSLKNQILDLVTQLLKKYGLRINTHKTRCYSLYTSNHVRITGVNISKGDDNRRHLTIGRTVKNQLFWDAIKCFEFKDDKMINHVKGLQSFVLSIEKTGYESCYSQAMIEKVQKLGFSSLKEMIDSL